jgi:hypothetical protein
VIPHLIGVRQNVPVPVTVSHPKSEVPLANNTFVGITGAGLDSAEYAANDEKTAKKRGVFGYDRVTTREQVSDGLNQTIVLLMVPGDKHPSPWLAGGGATLRGVADVDEDTRPIDPFVCYTHQMKVGGKMEPKRGTIAIMGDGKVRFIPVDMEPATFRALCTVAGNDKVDNLDVIAPVIPNESQRDLRSDELPKIPVPPKEQPKEQPKKGGASNNKGKIEGTKWANNAGKAKGQDIPADVVTLEFKADMTFVQTLQGVLTVPGKYSLGSGDDVTMEVDLNDLPKELPEELRKEVSKE